jgi:hypothetical protein
MPATDLSDLKDVPVILNPGHNHRIAEGCTPDTSDRRNALKKAIGNKQ